MKIPNSYQTNHGRRRIWRPRGTWIGASGVILGMTAVMGLSGCDGVEVHLGDGILGPATESTIDAMPPESDAGVPSPESPARTLSPDARPPKQPEPSLGESDASLGDTSDPPPGSDTSSPGAGEESSGTHTPDSSGEEESSVSSPVQGLWTSAAELASKPMSGEAWETVMDFADRDTSDPDVDDQDDHTNVSVLAAAIVYARSGDEPYRNKVITACKKAISKPSGRTLAWGREVGAYALAADLVGFRSSDFEGWLADMADGFLGSQIDGTLRYMFERRPNNWGSMAFGSLAAIYAYLGKGAELRAIREYWVQMVTGPKPGGVKYGNLSWHFDRSNPRLINPKGATKEGVNIDGIIPDDMRRGGSFTTGSPGCTGYPWEHLQGIVMAARILERQGMPIWNVADKAIYRAAHALQVRLKGCFLSEGDDLWQLAFLDAAFGTNWANGQSSRLWGAGKNAGFPYVLP